MSKQIEAMRKLGMSEEEIADVLESDKRSDRGEKLFELDPELEKGAKKARQADRKKQTEPTKRERKKDDDKGHLLALMMEVVKPEAETLEQTKEAEFEFVFNGRKFKVVLSAPRK